MRPIERGPCPKDPNTNTDKVYKTYTEARRDLIDRLGEYCSYCEMRLNASLAVEHVQPKRHHPNLELEWHNFLLACTNCNSTKGSQDIALDAHYWADVHNTFMAFQYVEGGKVVVHPGLTKAQKAKAKRTIELVGLDKTPDKPDASDRRWQNRKEVWEIAKINLKRLENTTDKTNYAKAIVDMAKGYGFWSIWVAVFINHPEVLQGLMTEFIGTYQACFDKNNHYAPISRTNDL
ncbi:MAG: HNH endonuclease [Candidatus Parabeggiatoa sp. nov. 1]|nr:MAG: HNH endonuclease [Gammaproteobacteria bacterium]